VSLAGEDEKTALALLRLGVRHILTGPDHLLFVFGLLLIVRDRWKLVKTVSAFTVAHSIALGAVVLGKLTLYPPFVESMIALSILFLAPEIVRARRGGTSLTIRFPWAVAFAFGLFHGMGFAGALTELALAARELFTALALFNVGVEIGQVLFIALVLLAARALLRREMYPAAVSGIPAYVVGVAGAYWFAQCCATLFGVT
jgi:hydrogenase/urease accessory protein HupE